VTSANGQQRELPTKVVDVLLRGDTLRIETPGGGGWGDPANRDPAAVADDVAEGLLSPGRAEEIYGRRT
jgi:N-methylhydantoinase B